VTSLRPALLALALVAGALAAPTPAVAAEAPSERDRRSCQDASAPFDVGTATITVRSRGNRLRTTVAYPATSSGEGATPVCRKSPLVVAGHGAEGDGASAARLHYYLVQRGYVVAAPTFPASGFDFDGFAQDVSRTITKVLRSSRSDSGPVSGLVRRHGKVGYIGTSMGAITGITLCDRGHRDRRIGAVVAKAGAAMGRSLHAKGAPPVLMLNGDADTTIPYDEARTTYADLARPKGLVTLAGVGHDLNTGSDPILVTASSLFLDRYLRHRKHALNRIVRAADHSDVASLRERW
jgi:dienelactone hydrolase